MVLTTEEALALVPDELKEQMRGIEEGISVPGLDAESAEKLRQHLQEPRYYGLQGEPIDRWTWASIFEAFDVRQIAHDEIGPYFVSTVWLGLDHSFGHGRPLIFETMVFEKDTTWHEPMPEMDVGRVTLPPMPGFAFHKDFEQRRYSTQEEALAGHAALVNEIGLLVAANPDWRIEGEGYAPMDNG